ncbi:MAG: hypothetical protein KME06_11255 [Kastovskya adunca ATA6-11-RM4]|nr:hypothetical protein [Kastovskya adunca ATA6-11-RM4]
MYVNLVGASSPDALSSLINEWGGGGDRTTSIFPVRFSPVKCDRLKFPTF